METPKFGQAVVLHASFSVVVKIERVIFSNSADIPVFDLIGIFSLQDLHKIAGIRPFAVFVTV